MMIYSYENLLIKQNKVSGCVRPGDSPVGRPGCPKPLKGARDQYQREVLPHRICLGCPGRPGRFYEAWGGCVRPGRPGRFCEALGGCVRPWEVV